MQINTQSGLIEEATYIPSPNMDERPDSCPADLLVIHSISLPPGEYGGQWIEKLFTNTLPPDEHPYFREIEGITVSSHILIQRNGTIIQFVPFHKRAWHAGVSSYDGRAQCNDYAIGIELEGTDTDPFEHAQYQQLATLLICLAQTYVDISLTRVTGHSDIAPNRKTDPGTGFDWNKLKQLLHTVD